MPAFFIPADTLLLTHPSLMLMSLVITPHQSALYYHTLPQRKDLQQEVEKLLFDNVIRPSTSPWSFPVILRKKADGTFRFLVDFRRLNSVTKKESYPQRSVEELLLHLARHRYFTKLDLKSGYFLIPITDADKEKTAFVTPEGHFEFNVLAQGLMNASATFQRVMNNLIATGRWDYVVVYFDDIVIFSHCLEDHQRHVDEMLSIIARDHFKVSPPQCSITSRRIEFLHHFVTSSTVEPSPDEVQVILDIPSPRTYLKRIAFSARLGTIESSYLTSRVWPLRCIKIRIKRALVVTNSTGIMNNSKFLTPSKRS